jgi:acyl-[acyl carrier protein]--UDP-N-acetylglucosamine O-acyltransferase
MIKDLKKAYREVFDPSGPIKEHLERLSKEVRTAPVKEFLSFIQDSQRGICRPSSKEDPAENG